MSTDLLGEYFDIHGGGGDLKFPHHENEVAQSEGAHDGKFVNYWLHVGFVRVNKEKMSKSLGNFFTIREVLEKYSPEVIRYFLLFSHYRSPVDYSEKSLTMAAGALERLYLCLRGLPVDAALIKNSQYERHFNDAMDDDFNTPEALAVLFELSHEINRQRQAAPEKSAQLAVLLRRLGQVLGLFMQTADDFFQGLAPELAIDQKAIEQLIQQREQARQQKNWAEADRIRQELEQQNILLEDKPEGTLWRRK